MVYVHNVVTRLYCAEFLQRQGKFAAAGTLPLEGIFMETVENLMVGKHAPPCSMVNESFMEGRQHGGEGDVVAPLGKYCLKACNLFLAVGKYIERVSVGQQLAERVGNKVEILMIKPLGSALEIKFHTAAGYFTVSAARTGCRREVQLGKRFETGIEFIGVDKVLHRRGIPLVGNHDRSAESFTSHSPYTRQGIVSVAQGNQSVGRYEFKHTFTPHVAAAAHIGSDRYGLKFLFRQLGLDVESAYRVNLVTEKVDAVRQLARISENIENRATHGKMPRLIHIILLLEAVFT